MVWVNQEYQSYHRYDEPQGTAIKVMKASGIRRSDVARAFIVVLFKWGVMNMEDQIRDFIHFLVVERDCEKYDCFL